MKKAQSKYETSSGIDVEYFNFLKNNKELQEFDINEENYIEIGNMYEQQMNCSKCEGLSHCKNNTDGFCKTAVRTEDGMYFAMAACKYRNDYLRECDANNYLNTLYISKRILNASLDNYYLTTSARQKAAKYVNNFVSTYDPNKFQKGLCLHGPCGCGKTYLLACLANELAKYRVESLLIYVPDLVRDLKNMMGTPRLEETMNMLKKVPVLILDDLGSEMMSPWVRDEILSPLFNYRMMDEKSIFISTNLNPQSLQKHFSSTNVDEDIVKATRIMTRLQSLVSVLKFE